MKKITVFKRDYVTELVKIIRNAKNAQTLQRHLSNYHDKDIAEAITKLSETERMRLYTMIDIPRLAEIFSYLDDAKPYLDELDLTYTQYITMMVMWEHKEMNVKELGEHLYLDSGTLTPVLKKLEQKGWVKRNRAKEDERVLIVTLTAEGERLRDKAVEIPQKVGGCVCLDQEEAASLYKILYKILGNM